MPNIKTLNKQYKKSLNTRAPAYPIQSGFLGASDGVTVRVPNKDHWVYVRLWNGDILQAFNSVVPATFGLPVTVEWRARQFFIKSALNPYNEPIYTGLPDGVEKQLSWPGAQAVPINGPQFTPGLVAPKTGMIVSFFGGTLYDSVAGWVRVAPVDIDMTSHIPVSGAQWALLEMDTTGGITVTTGGAVANYGALLFSAIPAPTTIALCAIAMYTGQTTILQTAYASDIYDLRFFTGAGGGGGGGPTGPAGGDLSGTYPNPTVAKVNGNTPGVAAVTHKFVTTIDSSARGTLAQPDYSDLTGTPSSLPPSGTAGGELSGSYPNPSLSNAAVIGKLLTAFTAGAGTVSATDSILTAFQKVVGNIALKLTANAPITPGTNTKITYDANGLVTGGAAATPADIGSPALVNPSVAHNLVGFSNTAGGQEDSGLSETNVSSAVSLKHTQGTDTALGSLGTKNPPIDADKAIYRDSTAADALVTSTFTQVKAFLKTYFDGVYSAITHALLSTTHSDTVAGTPVLGGVIAANGTPAWQQVAGNTTATQKFLAQTGNGSISALPTWQAIPLSSILTYYFQNTASAVAGYLKQLSSPYTPKTTLTYSGVGTTPVVLKNWITDPSIPNQTFIPAGQYLLHIHASNTGPGNATIYGEFWEANSSGVDIAKIGTTETSYQESGAYLPNTEAEFELAFVSANVYTLASSASRIVLRLYGVMAGGTHSLEIYVGDTADTHITLPAIPVDTSAFVPYSGATQNVNLGSNTLVAASVNTITAFDAANPQMDGAAAPGSGTVVSHGNHVHPIDTSRAPLASPTFTGDPQAPTPATNDNDTSIPTTAWVNSQFGAGWIPASGTWSYSSADSPTFVISVNADMTGIISVGMRIKLTQTTVKYFIVTVVGAFGGGATLITVYGGTDYTLASAAISAPFYSGVKEPFGFPADPDKWTVLLSDTSNSAQASPSASTWYNLGSLSISIPIGKWLLWYALSEGVTATFAAATTVGIRSTLSTANNSESDVTLSSVQAYIFPIITAGVTIAKQVVQKPITMAAKTTYYLNAFVGAAGTTSLNFRGDVSATTIRLVCAYL